MLYMNNDGSFTIDDKPTPAWFTAERKREERERMERNAERYAEMQRAAWAAECKREYERQLSEETAERDAIIELVETAEESAMSELAAFGFIASDFERKPWDYEPDEVVCLYEYGGYGVGIEFDEPFSFALMV